MSKPLDGLFDLLVQEENPTACKRELLKKVFGGQTENETLSFRLRGSPQCPAGVRVIQKPIGLTSDEIRLRRGFCLQSEV